MPTMTLPSPKPANTEPEMMRSLVKDEVRGSGWLANPTPGEMPPAANATPPRLNCIAAPTLFREASMFERSLSK